MRLGPRSSVASRCGDTPTTRVSGRLAAPADVLTGLPVHDDHLAGRLTFGPDGLLYLSLGDEGATSARTAAS